VGPPFLTNPKPAAASMTTSVRMIVMERMD
jgi:hypothetical protein